MTVLVPAPPAGCAVEVDSVPASRWDAIAAGFDDANPEQTACYAASHWKGRDSHLLLSRDGQPVAGARVAVVKLPLAGRGLALLRFGPFWRRRGEEADPDIYGAVIDALVAEYCDRRGHCLTVLPRPHPRYHAAECALLREHDFAQRRRLDDAERYLVDASLDEKTQMASLDKTWRYNLRQGLAAPVEIGFGESPQEIEAFNTLYRGMMERKRFSSSTPVHLTGALMAHLPEALRPRLVVARHEGRIVAGATVGIFGDTACYMFGATSAEALPLQAGYALQWWVLRWLRERKVAWYDLGGAAHDPGLRRFKKGFVGKAGRILAMQGEFDYWTSPLGRACADTVLALRELRRRIRHGARFGS